MFRDIIYKKQGDGSDSWVVSEYETQSKKILLNRYMVYSLTCFNWTLKAVLNEDGLLTSVETALGNLPEPQKTNANLAWNFAPTIDSNGDTTEFIRTVLNLTKIEVVDIFLRANEFKI